ncbi:MAG: hypothetical protein ACOCNL_08550 [Acetivibrio ethanolgignens]
MVNKTDLENLYQLEGEIQDIERQMKKLKPKSREFVGDTVRDYRSGQGVPVTIRGYSERACKTESKLLCKYETKKEKLAKEKIKLEEELDKIEDIGIRRIIRLRYFERMPWEMVAAEVDAGKTGDCMRKRLDEYLIYRQNKS